MTSPDVQSLPRGRRETADDERIDDGLNEDSEENRKLASHMIAIYRGLMTDVTVSATSIAKWILTSLLAINGAAAISAWQIAIDPRLRIAACASFVIGVLLALLCGHLQVKRLGELAKPIGVALGYWVSVESDGFRASALEGTTDMEVASERVAKFPTVVGWLSVCAFILGAVLAGLGSLGMPTHSP